MSNVVTKPTRELIEFAVLSAIRRQLNVGINFPIDLSVSLSQIGVQSTLVLLDDVQAKLRCPIFRNRAPCPNQKTWTNVQNRPLLATGFFLPRTFSPVVIPDMIRNLQILN